MERTAMRRLVDWKEKERRKPLLISGCRQCGKTWLATEFGRRYYEKTFVFNFEKEPALAEVFRYDLDPRRILRELGLFREGKPIDPERSLVVFDEIQRCMDAVASLKYFEESGLNAHLLCAGSLLGVELKRRQASFPVGKCEQLRLYPLNFPEFVEAVGGGQYLTSLREYERFREIPSYIAEPMSRYLKLYFVVGGMPEAVQTWIDSENVGAVDAVLDQIILGTRADFSHYADPNESLRIAWIWDSIPKQLAKENNKFVFSHVKTGARARDFEDALLWLVDAGLAYRLEKVVVPNVPLSAFSDAASFKVYANDVGILRRNAGIAGQTILTESEGYSTFKGAYTENYCMTELVAQGRRPYYWRSDNVAELDFLFEDRLNRIVPMEVKAAEHTKAKSFSLFCKRYAPQRGFKISGKNVGDNQKGATLEISLPLYLLWKLDEYLQNDAQSD